MDISDDRCSLSLGTMKWSELHIARYLDQELELLDEKNYPHGIAIASLIETNDAYFIFGERWNTSAGKDVWQISMIWWTLQPDEAIVDSYRWFYDHILRELHEEVWIGDQYIFDNKIVGIQRMQNGWIGFIYYLRLNLSKDQCMYMFEQENDEEFQALKFVAKTEVIGFLKDLCFKDWILRRTMGLQIDYLEEIFRNT